MLDNERLPYLLTYVVRRSRPTWQAGVRKKPC